MGKWGGLTGCRAVALRAPAHGAVFCPHWLGGPLGLLASMHLRAALGTEGWVEWDANPNPIHQPLQAGLPVVTAGQIMLGASPGLGPALSIEAWDDRITWHGSLH